MIIDIKTKSLDMNQGTGEKFVLELNSHSLSNFQSCEQKFKFTELNLLIPNVPYYPFKRGTGIANYLAHWYTARRKNYPHERLRKLENKLFQRMLKANAFVNTSKTDDPDDINSDGDQRLLIASRLQAYFKKYRNETYKVIAVEKGFTKILYEDEKNLFLYSGRPDVVLDYGENFGIGPMDHKSESQINDILPFNNQFAGYCWALNAKFGITNYIGLQKDIKDGKVLRRKAFNFDANRLNKWQSDTIEWYFRIQHAIQHNSFLRSWNCQGQYGACAYYPVCSAGNYNEELINIKRNFVQRDKPYRSW